MTVEYLLDLTDMEYECTIYDSNHEVEMYVGWTDDVPEDYMGYNVECFGIETNKIVISIFMED